MILTADAHDTYTEKHDPAGDAHTPQGAVDGHHAAKFDGDLFAFYDKGTAYFGCVGDSKIGGADTLGLRHQIEGVRIPVAIGLVYVGGQVVCGIAQAQTQPKPEKLSFVSGQIVLIAGPDKLFDVVREGGIVQFMDVGEIHHLLDQSQILRREFPVIADNSCDLLHGYADRFDEIRLFHLKSLHDRIFDDHSAQENE